MCSFHHLHHCFPRLGSVTGQDKIHTTAQQSKILIAADKLRAMRMPRESPRTMTTSLCDSELLRRSFSLTSADSVSKVVVISFVVDEIQPGVGEWSTVRSPSVYVFAWILASQSREIASQGENRASQSIAISESV